MFTTKGDSSVSTCRSTYHGGQCWWWAANTFMALISYAEDHPGTHDARAIERDVQHNYSVMCGQGSCPSRPYETGRDSFQNTYYDDTGWWDQAWINAYKLTKTRAYLDLAEELWSYITARGWSAICGGGVEQHSGPRKSGEDAYANALYLRNSAWLYSITGNRQYMVGVPDGSHKKGGAIADASFITDHLIDGPYNHLAPGTSGSQFMIADHPAPGCKSVGGTQMWLSAQGEMVNAFSDMYAADKAFGAKDPVYYNHLANDLALSVINNKPSTHGTIRATVDARGILSEPCDSKTWPAGCKLHSGQDGKGEAPFLIFKGIFERGIYCSNHNLNDAALTTFIAKNADVVAQLNHFGFQWDSAGNTLVNFATQTSVLDGLDAQTGRSFAMC